MKVRCIDSSNSEYRLEKGKIYKINIEHNCVEEMEDGSLIDKKFYYFSEISDMLWKEERFEKIHENLEEGDYCQHFDCDGKMEFPHPENCSCHINPPCGECVNLELECTECGWRNGDPMPCESPKVNSENNFSEDWPKFTSPVSEYEENEGRELIEAIEQTLNRTLHPQALWRK